MEKKVEKENQMISVHGNKSSLALAGICMITLLLMFAGLISERKTKVCLSDLLTREKGEKFQIIRLPYTR